MSWTIEYNSDLKIVLVKSGGIWTPEQDMDMLEALRKSSDEHKCLSLLIDHRGCTMDFGFMSIYNRPEVYEKLQFPKDVKAALIFNKIVDDNLFFENVCVNRGFNVKIFDNYDLAMKWLIADVRPNL
jgi:hypothetical protein